MFLGTGVTNHARRGQSLTFQFGQSGVDVALIAAANDDVRSVDGQSLGHMEPDSTSTNHQ